MRAVFLSIVMFVFVVSISGGTLDDVGRPFLQHLPYRVYTFHYQTPNHISYSWPWFIRLPNTKSVFAIYDSLQNKTTDYISLSLTMPDKDSTLFCIFADSVLEYQFESSMLIDPKGDTLKLWSNNKPIASSLDQLLIQRKLEHHYLQLVGKYDRLKDETNELKIGLYASGVLTTTLSTVGTALLLSDDTKKQNAGGICLAIGVGCLVEGIINYYKAKPTLNECGELQNRLKNWSQEDTDSLITTFSGQ